MLFNSTCSSNIAIRNAFLERLLAVVPCLAANSQEFCDTSPRRFILTATELELLRHVTRPALTMRHNRIVR